LEVPAAHASIEAALSAPVPAAVDVVLLDVNLPGMSGVSGIAELLSRWGDIEVVMLTVFEEAGVVFEALEAGATGYLAKSALPEEIVAAVREVAAGGAPMSSTIARKVIARFRQSGTGGDNALPELTERENELLAQLAEGRLDKEIADDLGITLATVKTHLRSIYRKLQVQNRTEAARRYLQRD
jgi:DNA-binding NarL/FixJ family response regulator